MKKLLLLFSLATLLLFLISCGKESPIETPSDSTLNIPYNSSSKESDVGGLSTELSTGVYGTIYFDYQCCPEDYYLVDGVTVYIYIDNVYHGSTVASACGYYTYDTGGDHGAVRVYVPSQYRPIRYMGCGSIQFYDSAAGDEEGDLSSGYWVQINVKTL